MSDFSSPQASSPLALAGPLYNQIKKLIKARVQSGEWSDGRAMPNEADLARQYGVSLGTMRKALEQLGREKLIVRRQGRGTFVENGIDARNVAKSSWHLDFQRRSGLNDSIRTSELAKDIVTPTEDEASALGVARFSKAARVRVLAIWQDKTSSIDTFTIPVSTFQSQNIEFEILKSSVFDIVAQIEPHVSQYTDAIALTAAGSDVARTLSVDEGQPLLEIRRVASDRTQRPLFLLKRLVSLCTAIEYVTDLS